MDQFSVAFPERSVVCAAGDYLVCHGSGDGWKVYRVEDLLLVKRLIPVLNDPSTLLVEEHSLDSMAPAYANEVQLLLTAFDPGFPDESKALHAVQHQNLTEHARGLLRPAREFTEADCRRVPQAGIPAQVRPG